MLFGVVIPLKFGERSEHGAILHVMPVDEQHVVRGKKLVVHVEKQRAISILLAREAMVQIIGVVGLHHGQFNSLARLEPAHQIVVLGVGVRQVRRHGRRLLCRPRPGPDRHSQSWEFQCSAGVR